MVVPRVKIQIVDNRANPNTVKDVAQGAPDYGSEGQRLRPRASPPKPHSKQHDDTRHDSRQDQGAAGEPTREHPERHAFIEAEPHIEKWRSEEHTSELQSLMRISYAVFCLQKKNNQINNNI